MLVTNRPTWEGGQFSGSEEERIDLLCRALQWGARYVDIELMAAPDSRARILQEAKMFRRPGDCFHHDFQGTPTAEQLRTTLQQMIDSGADIGKIVTTAASPADTLRILSLQEEAMAARFPLSAFAMGAARSNQPSGNPLSRRIHDLCGPFPGTGHGPWPDNGTEPPRPAFPA